MTDARIDMREFANGLMAGPAAPLAPAERLAQVEAELGREYARIMASPDEAPASLAPAKLPAFTQWWNAVRANLTTPAYPKLVLVPLTPEPLEVPITITLTLDYYDTLALMRRFRNPASEGGVRPFTPTEIELWAVLAVNAALSDVVRGELTDDEREEAAGV